MKTTGPAENSLEVLESRIAPSGVVTVTLQAGVLTISGDAGSNQLVVSAAPNDQILIAALDTTTDVGAGPGIIRMLAGPVKRVVSDMGDGTDVLWLTGLTALTEVNVNGGNGEDSFLFSNLSVRGSVLASLGPGGDTVVFDGATTRIGGNIVIGAGDGENSLLFLGDKVSVSGSLIYSGGDGDDRVRSLSTDAKFSKNVSLSLGEGNNVTFFEQNSATRILGKLSITGGNGGDNFTVGSGGALSVRKNLTLELGNGSNAVNQFPESGPISIGGTYRATGGTGLDNFQLGGVSFTARDMFFDLGEGENMAAIGVSSVKVTNLSLTSGAGNDLISLNGTNFTVKGKLNVRAGDGENQIRVRPSNLLVKGASSFTSGSGSEVLEFTGSGKFAGPVSINLGTGGVGATPQTLSIFGSVAGFVFANSVTIQTSGDINNTDRIELRSVEVRKKLNISMGDGNSTAVLDEVYLRSSLLLQTNGGNDTVSFERTNFSPLESLAMGSVTIRTGAGNDTALIGTGVPGARVDFRGKLSVVDNEGTNTTNAIAVVNLFAPGKLPEIVGFQNIII